MTERVGTAESDQRRRNLRPAVALAGALGLLVIGTYIVLRERHAAGARQPVPRSEQQRIEQPPAPAAGARPVEPPPTPLTFTWAKPDLSLWSPERIKAWQLASSVPEIAPLAVLRIPKIHLEVPVLEGTDEVTLDYGVGHVEGTPLPGEGGNLGIAGHRDGFFRGLKDIVTGDVIELETGRGLETYVIEDIWFVDPDDVWVLEPTASSKLTLVTCYPFYHVGSAPRRYIVRAARAAAPAG
jgi:sortase A